MKYPFKKSNDERIMIRFKTTRKYINVSSKLDITIDVKSSCYNFAMRKILY